MTTRDPDALYAMCLTRRGERGITEKLRKKSDTRNCALMRILPLAEESANKATCVTQTSTSFPQGDEIVPEEVWEYPIKKGDGVQFVHKGTGCLLLVSVRLVLHA